MRDFTNMKESYSDRLKLIAELIPVGVSVLDLGCGMGELRTMLTDCDYAGSDHVQRDAHTIVCDLNKSFPDGYYDYIIFSGVLEYLDDPLGVLRNAKEHTNNIIFSYSCHNSNAQYRAENGWVNYLSHDKITGFIAGIDWQIENEQQWIDQTIFKISNNE